MPDNVEQKKVQGSKIGNFLLKLGNNTESNARAPRIRSPEAYVW
jgi:hypothetical protein